MDWLTNIKSFIDVANYQSFTKAAEKRYSSPAVLSRRIAWLEEELGVSLMQRTTRSLQLTEEGKQFYIKGKQWLAHLGEITLQLQNQQQVVQGPLHITMPYAFGETKLTSELIAKFAAEQPNIELILNFTNQNLDLIENSIDIAFRASPFEGKDYSSLKLTTIKLGVYASSNYLRNHPPIKTLNDITSHNCLLHHQIGYTEWEFKAGKKILVSGNLKSNASRALIEFAKQDLGLVRTLDCYVKKDVKAKTLQPILESQWHEIHLYLISKDKPTAALRVQAFVDFMKNYSLSEYLVYS